MELLVVTGPCTSAKLWRLCRSMQLWEGCQYSRGLTAWLDAPWNVRHTPAPQGPRP